MNFLTKLTLLFILLSIIPLAVVGYLAFENGRQSLEQNTLNHLISINILKEAELNSWVGDSEIMLRQLGIRPLVQSDADILVSADPASPEYRLAYENLLKSHLAPMLEENRFNELFVLNPSDGRVLICTEGVGHEGKYRDSEPYFLEGKKRTYAQNPYYSIGPDKVTMTVSTPVRDRQGRLVAVLAGHLNLNQMADIMLRRSGLSASEETYLVNKFNFFVTDPKAGLGVAMRKSIHTDGVTVALAHNDGVGFYDNYAGTPVIGAYRWIPELEMCIITEVNQDEAFDPIVALRNILLAMGLIIATLAATGGVFFARTITSPLLKLAKGADVIGRGNMDYRIEIKSRDEIGRLADAFNTMTTSYKQVENKRLIAESQVVASRTTLEMIEIIPDPVFAYDMHGRITQFNRAVTGLLGYGQEIIGELPTMLVTESEVPRVLEAIKEIAEVGFLRNKEFSLKAKDGKHIPVLLNAVLRKDREGNPVGMMAVLRDITEIKQASETLQESEERFRVAAASASDLIWEWDIPGGRLEWYGMIDEILGYRPGEFPRTIEAWETAIHKDDIGHVNAVLKQHLKEGTPYEREYRIQSKNGTYRYWVDHGSALRNEAGEPVKMIGACSDITERKQAEESLQASETQYRLLADHTNDMIWLMDMNLKTVYLSPSTEKISGFTLQERMELTMEQSLTPESLKLASDLFIKELPYVEADPDYNLIHTLELEYYCKDGTTRWTEDTFSVIRDNSGKPAFILGEARDITERKSNARALAEKTVQLERSNEELQRFAYVASHDLKEPLRTISSYLQLLERRNKSKLDKEAVEFIDIAVNGASRLQNMISGLLEYSRVETKGEQFEIVNGESVIIQVIGSLKKSIEESKADITHDPLPEIYGDREQLVRLFQNLISNSIRYHGKQQPRVHISAEKKISEYAFSIQDNGIGIAPEYKEQIFIIFQRLQGREVPGIGLGLAVAKRIVERHGGRIWLESEPGQGATFYFTIPMKGGNRQ